jgi:hypothetical protein
MESGERPAHDHEFAQFTQLLSPIEALHENSYFFKSFKRLRSSSVQPASSSKMRFNVLMGKVSEGL